MAVRPPAAVLFALACAACLAPGCKEKTYPPLGEVDRAQPKEKQCLQQMHYLSLALHRYMDDHKGRLPGEDWREVVLRCGAKEEWLHCPAGGAAGHDQYMFNRYLLRADTRAIDDPGQIVLLTEGTTPVGGPEDISARHDGRVSVAFLDGTVKLMPASRVLRARWNPAEEPTPAKRPRRKR